MQQLSTLHSVCSRREKCWPKRGNTHFQREFDERAQKKKSDDGHILEVTFNGHKLMYTSEFGKVAGSRTEFRNNLLRNIDSIFPREVVYVASAFHILGMKPLIHLSEAERQEFGQKKLDILIDHYRNNKKARRGKLMAKLLLMESDVEKSGQLQRN